MLVANRTSVMVATVLTVYGIETYSKSITFGFRSKYVATVLTVYGIETLSLIQLMLIISNLELQQYLPFTVLKLVHLSMLMQDV